MQLSDFLRSGRLLLAAVALANVPSALQAQTALDAEQAAFLNLINNFRAQNGFGSLQISGTLQSAAQWMSADMAAKSYFSHTDSLGRDAGTRIRAFGYSYYPLGENIAAGNADAQRTFEQWVNSPGHRANMLNGSFNAIGIGRAYNASSPYRWYWTTDFGGYADGGGQQAPISKIGTYRNGAWWLDRDGSRTFNPGDSQFVFGNSTSKPLVGNFSGSGADTIAVFDAGNWYIDVNGDGAFNAGDTLITSWGSATSTPIIGDWNGAGRAKIGAYDNGLWFLDYNGSSAWDAGDRQIGFGYAGCPCKPVVGDWNGDRRAKIGLFVDDGVSRFWYLDYNGDGQWSPGAGDRAFAYGPANSLPVTGDWNGDGRIKVGVYSDAVFYLDYNGNGLWDPGVDKSITWGAAGSTPLIGDWNGDGRADIGAFRDGYFYLDLNGNGTFESNEAIGWGRAGDIPLAGVW
jgi:uncharacterized protein YkwD